MPADTAPIPGLRALFFDVFGTLVDWRTSVAREAERVLAPLGVLLPNGLGLNVDGQDMGRVAFVRCLPNGCIAEVVLDDSLIETLSNGTDAIFVVFKTPEEGIGIPVSLNGFKDGFAQLP